MMATREVVHSVLIAVAVVAGIAVLSHCGMRRSELFQKTMQTCMDRHPPLECEKSVSW